MIARFAKRIGANYLWGLANFTAGVTLGGGYVAALLVAWGAVR
jgi:hypothetical protein